MSNRSLLHFKFCRRISFIPPVSGTGTVNDILSDINKSDNKLATENPNIGNVRESFFINQLGELGPMKYTPEGDFAFKDHVFEIGGRGKTNKQVKHLDQSYVVADGIEVGHLHKIPLWMFGFFY